MLKQTIELIDKSFVLLPNIGNLINRNVENCGLYLFEK